MRRLIILILLLGLLPAKALVDTGANVEYIPGTSNLGVGVSSPNSKLTINGGVAFKEVVSQGATANYGKVYVNSANHKLYFKDNGGVAYNLINGSTAGSAAAAGSNTQFQFNDSNALGGNGALTFTKASKTLAVAADAPLDINSTTVSIADTDITLDGASTTFTQSSGAITLAPAAGSNLNISLATTGDLAVNTNDFYVDTSAGRIGLGTTTPLQPLHINGGGLASEKNASILFTPKSLANWSLGVHNGDSAKFKISNGTALSSQPHFTILKSGNIGVGYITPTSKLHINGDTATRSLTLNGNTLSIPSLTQGDLLFTKVAGSITRLAKGTDHYLLKTNGNTLAWEAAAAGVTAIDGLRDGISNAYNVYLGNGAGAVDSGTSYATGVGIGALSSNVSSGGLYNSAFGYQTLYSNTSGDDNSASGYRALYSNDDGVKNTASGSQVLYSNVDGSQNTASGYKALYLNVSGNQNVASGYQTLYNNTGSFNTATGTQALYSNTSGAYNTAVGRNALYSNSTASNNTALGYMALYNGTGLGNIAMGFSAGNNITSGTKNIIIGYSSSAPSATASGQLVIGNLIYGNGMTATGSTISGGKTGINKANPAYTLDVNGTEFSKAQNFNGNAMSIPTLGQGSILFSKVGGTLAALDNGASSSGKVLRVNGNTLAWESVTAASLSPMSSSTLAGLITDETGTAGSLVFSNSPTLVTPTLGVASATTINKVTLTAPATGSTLTIADGKTLTSSNTLTFTGTDSSSVAFGGGGTVIYTSNNLSALAATTSAQLASVLSDEVGTGKVLFNGTPLMSSATLNKTTTINGNTLSIPTLGQGSILFSKVAGSLAALDNGASSNHKALKVNGNTLAWETLAATTPGGSNTWFQFNDSSGFGGNGALTFTKASKTLAIPADAPLDINSTTVSIADTDITLDGASTTFTQSSGAITLAPAAGSNLNISLATTGDLAVNTNDFYVDTSAGRIGLGTTTPLQPLHINGGGLASEKNASILFTPKSLANWSLGVHNGDSAKFKISNGTALSSQPHFTILKSGNIGVGYVTPTSKLHVNGDTATRSFTINGNTLSIPSLTQGDLLFTKVAGSITRLAKGTTHYLLKTNGNTLAWEANTLTNIDGFTDAKANATDYFVGNGSGAAWTSSATYNTAIGVKSLNAVNATTGTYNSTLGYNGLLLTSTGDYNVAMGYNAGRAITTASNNTAIGSLSLSSNTASNSTAIGYSSMYTNTSGSSNTGLGYSALYSNSTGTRNTAVGYYSAYGSSNMDNGTFLGYNAGRTISTGDDDTFIGYLSGNGNTTGSYNTSVGSNALAQPTTGARNTAVGYFAGEGTSGSNFSNGTFLGYSTGLALTTGANNILIGYQAGDAMTSGGKNIVIGYDVDAPSNTLSGQLTIGNLIFGNGMTASTGTTVAGGKVGINKGNPAYTLDVNGTVFSKAININGSTLSLSQGAILFSKVAGSVSTLTKGTNHYALKVNGNTLAWESVSSSGGGSGSTNIDGLSDARADVYSTYLGNGSGLTDSNHAARNTGVGINALRNTNSVGGIYDTAVGYYALYTNTSGYDNTALGADTLEYNTTGLGNTATGRFSLYTNTTGQKNAGLGTYSLYYTSTGSYNTAVGYLAGEGTSGSSFSNSTFLGYSTALSMTTGSNNILIGYQAGDAMTSGSNNIVIGYDIDAPSNTSSNQLTIGNIIFATGVDGSGTSISTGNVGIGVASPGYKLDITGDLRSTTGANFATSSGNVGIGNTSTSYKLDITGNFRNTTGAYLASSSGNVGIATTSPAAIFEVSKASTYNNEASAGISILSGSSDSKLIFGADASNDLTYIQSMQQGTSYATRPLTINPNGGNVGIGASSIGAALEVNGAIMNSVEYSIGNSGTSKTIVWTNGNKQYITLTGNCTFTFTSPSGAVGNFMLRLVQDGTGSRTVTWPASVKWPSGTAPTLTTTAGGVDIVSCYYNGTNYYCVASLAFS